MKTETSWDDGSAFDFRICELLTKYKLPGIFYIPTINDLSESEIIQMSKDFDIGGHTVTHPNDMKELSPEDQYKEIKDNKDYLEKLIGRKITSFCSPSGRYNEVTIEQAKKAGFKENRTVDVLTIEQPEDPFRKATSIHVYPKRKEYKGHNWLKVAINLFEEAKEKGNYYHIWGHGWEIEKFRMWKELDQLFKHITK